MTATASRGRITAVVYFTLAGIGLIGTWAYNLTYRGSNYLGDWFANAASSSAAVDLIVIVAVCSVLYFRESRRLGWPIWIPIALVPLSALVATAFAFPLFLGLRELSISHHPQGRSARRLAPDAGSERSFSRSPELDER